LLFYQAGKEDMLGPIPRLGSHEVHRIRELLLTQYIGAIVIGLVLSQGITSFVSAVLVPTAWYLAERSAPRSVFGFTPPQPFNWDRFVLNLIAVVLYLLVAYLLLRWLYLQGGDGRAEPLQEPAAEG
jgi:hypothetical protein